jgi:rubredoxin
VLAGADEFKPFASPPPDVIAVDIPCPACGRADQVRKESLDRYRCDACGHEFSPEDISAP